MNGKSLESFKSAFSEYCNPLCYFANKLLGDSEEAEDLVDEVFIKLWQREPDFSKYRNLKAILYISVKNACFDQLQKRKKQADFGNGLQYHLAQETESYALKEIVRAEVLNELYTALEKLPVERRNVMRLLYVEGWDNKKVADELGISLHTVKKHRLKGINNLKESGISFCLLASMSQWL